MDLPERFCEQGTMKLIETKHSDRHGGQGGRIRERSCHVCCRVADLHLAHWVCRSTQIRVAFSRSDRALSILYAHPIAY
jgi:hypothetical protein